MKQNTLMRSVLLGLVLASPLASAEVQYPKGFDPVVVYQDADYIAKQKSGSVSSSASGTAVSGGEETSSSTAGEASKSADGLSQYFPVAGILVALVAFIVISNRGKSKSPEAAVEPAPVAAATGGQTGVARYMAASGIAVKSTGVASYISQVEVAAKEAASANTGVSRYLKNEGISGR